jgi:hypothetical protein
MGEIGEKLNFSQKKSSVAEARPMINMEIKF